LQHCSAAVLSVVIDKRIQLLLGGFWHSTAALTLPVGIAFSLATFAPFVDYGITAGRSRFQWVEALTIADRFCGLRH